MEHVLRLHHLETWYRSLYDPSLAEDIDWMRARYSEAVEAGLEDCQKELDYFDFCDRILEEFFPSFNLDDDVRVVAGLDDICTSCPMDDRQRKEDNCAREDRYRGLVAEIGIEESRVYTVSEILELFENYFTSDGD